MAKDEQPAISDETRDMLADHVKKGKARKFFLIYKGSTIKTLVVFKKGPFGPKIMKAKKEGFKGEVAYGVVTGSGKNLFFQLPGNGEVAASMKADSFGEKPPTKRAKLREFLSDNDLNFKPSYHIITDASNAPDPEAESDIPIAPPLPGTEAGDDEDVATTEAPAASIPEPPPLPESDAARFMTRLKALKPDLEKVIAGGVSVSSDVKKLAAEAGQFAKNKDFESANSSLDEIEKLIQQGLQEIASAPSSTTDDAAKFKERLQALLPKIKTAAGTPPGDQAKILASEAGALVRQGALEQAFAKLDEAEKLLTAPAGPSDASADAELGKKLAEALKKVKPLMEKVIQADPNRKAELQASIAQIAGEIKAKQFDQARQNVTTFVTMLKSLAAQAASPGGMEPADDTAESMEKFVARRDALEAQYLEAKNLNREKATAYDAAWLSAQEQADAGKFDTAFKILDRLESAVAGVVGATSGAPTEAPTEAGEEPEDPSKVVGNLIQYRTALLEYSKARSAVAQQVDAVAAALRKELPDEADLADELADILTEMNDNLWDVVDQEINAADEEKPARARMVRSQLQQMLGDLNSNNLVKIVDRSPLVNMSIKDTLSAALTRIISRIAA